jgi:hypothetical protein
MTEFSTVFLFTNIGVSQTYKAVFVIILYVLLLGASFLYVLWNINIPKQPSFIKGKVYIRDYRFSTISFLGLSTIIILFSPVLMFLILRMGIGVSEPLTFADQRYLELQRRYNSQQYLVAEGLVHVLHTQNPNGHEKGDIVRIGNTDFEINFFRQDYSYSQTIAYGGALTEGTYARIFYVENPPSYALKYLILRVDVRNE